MKNDDLEKDLDDVNDTIAIDVERKATEAVDVRAVEVDVEVV